ncbi:MAG: acetyl-CoA carboxyl transferase [Rhodoferax sp.]|nr:acetyl-CoA carboxyl transferase [Rhodoferax sp.]
MSIFRRPDYQSDTTQFIAQLKAEKPELEAQQRAGRALLWDKNVDRGAWREYRDGQVEQQPYVYQTQATKS